MPSSRTVRNCVAASLVLHLAIMVLFSFLRSSLPRPEDVMTVDLTDMPRTTDFLPPRAGIVTGERPKAPPPPKPERPPKEVKPVPPPREMTGRVPDLPVNPALPPEKEFLPEPPKETLASAKEAVEKPDKAVEKPSAPEHAGSVPDKPVSGNKPPLAPTAPGGGRPLKDFSLAQAVRMARIEPGGRGEEASAGSAVGTGGKPREKGEIVEEMGGGAHLTALNAPEIQYISYFAGIKRKIELVWQYPYAAAAAGIQGDLLVEFVIGRSGKLEGVTLVRGSGHKTLDDEALGSIRKAAPYAPIPADYKIPNLQIRAHFVYEMHALQLR